MNQRSRIDLVVGAGVTNGGLEIMAGGSQNGYARDATPSRRCEMKKCPRCGAMMTQGVPHTDYPCRQWECHRCGKIVLELLNER